MTARPAPAHSFSAVGTAIERAGTSNRFAELNLGEGNRPLVNVQTACVYLVVQVLSRLDA